MSYPADVYQADDGEASAVLTHGDAVPDLVYPSGVEVRHLALGSGTHGLFGLYRWDFSAARTGPDPHFHRSITESFFVLSGTVTLHDGKGWKDARPGDFLYVPEGGIHGFRNESGEKASMLLMFAPGAPREDYFTTLAHLAENPMTPDERAEFMLRHDTFWI
jgi:mannose-6-phosphate isomerase-like protein (cupin superfamily)